ncbi:MAG: hypothetical protein ACYC75_03620 [Minisyncoccota bacterium]
MKIFSSIGSFFKYVRGHAHRDPVRDWLMLLTISTIVLAGIIVWNAWAFNTVASGGVIGAPATAPSPVFSQSSLDAIQTIFASRAVEEQKYMTGAYRYADPSQ